MKYPRLRNMPINALIAIAQQKKDEKFTKYVEQIVMEKILEEKKSIVDLTIDFMSSSGLRRKKLGEVIALGLIDGINIIDTEFIDLLLSELEVDYLWMLSTNSRFPLIRQKAFTKINQILDEYEMDEELRNIYDEKVANDNLVFRLDRGDF